MAATIKYLFSFLLTIVMVAATAQKVPVVRGTWITNVASTAMKSPENIRQTVAHCKRNGLTDLFVVVWNRGVTMYPSKVVKQYIGIEQDTLYKGFDPLQVFVEEGHKAGLRVHAWFEFGFSYAYKDSSEQQWLKRYPHWVGRDNKGQLLKKNGFFGGMPFIRKCRYLCRRWLLKWLKIMQLMVYKAMIVYLPCLLKVGMMIILKSDL